jgi:uncharacterized protein (TIGR03435 family)
MTRAARTLIPVLVIGCAALPSAQPAPQPERFDVASVKPNNTGDQCPCFLSPMPDGLRVINLPISTLLWMAHGVQADQVVDMPSWARRERFDILAKAPAGLQMTMDAMRPMLRDLLADRFQLKTRRESRELPVYRLVQLKPGAAPSGRLKRGDFDCTQLGPPPPGQPAPAPPPAAAATPVPCGAFVRPGGVTITNFPLSGLARLMGPMTGRVVVDETGLEGPWSVELDFTPENVGPAGGAPAGPPPVDGLSIFTAVQEQLGLKLESTRAPVDVIVIERLERPSPD